MPAYRRERADLKSPYRTDHAGKIHLPTAKRHLAGKVYIKSIEDLFTHPRELQQLI